VDSPVLPSSAGDVLERALAERPDAEALVARDGRFTYRDLDDAADRAADALFSLGARRGDVIAVSLPNTSDAVVTFHAVMRLGGIWLGINRNLAPLEKIFILQDAGAQLLLADPEVGSDLRGQPVQTELVDVLAGNEGVWRELTNGSDIRYPRAHSQPTDAAGIAYTSGTTGRPKGVVHSHRNILLPGAMLTAVRGFGPDLRKGDCAALTILNMQVTTTLLVAQAGGTQIVMDRADPTSIGEWIQRERVTSWFGVPTLLHGLTDAPDIAPSTLASLRDVWSGGTWVPDQIRTAFERKFGARVYATYGLTEAPTVVTIEPLNEPHVPGSSGRALPHLCVEIRDEAGTVLPNGQLAEITVRPTDSGSYRGAAYTPMMRYHKQASATAATVRGGVLHTGDVGELDDRGNLFVRDRRNAVILRGGANVYPAEVERVLLEHETVVGAAVIGVPDERLGQRVAAAVELAPGATMSPDGMAEHCYQRLAKYKVPERWKFVSLPRNAMGKVSRSTVERLFQEST
jgi:acyl-CoA synthetase (AMP-forming)/AMP-acid ligase II